MSVGTSSVEPFRRPLVATIAVGVCCLLAQWLDQLEINAPYLSFLPAIVGSCAMGSFTLAVWALLLSSAGLWLFFIPPVGFGMPSGADLAHLGVFVAIALFVCWIIDGLRRSNDELSRDNVTLGVKLSTLLGRIRQH